jgi:Type IV secretory pathway, VirD4 components
MAPPKRASWEWLWKLGGLFALAWFLHGIVDPGGGRPIAWCLEAMALGWLAKLFLAAVADGRIPLEWVCSLLKTTSVTEQLVSEGDEAKTAGEAARAEVARLGGGAYLGLGRNGSWALADPESAVMVLGPPRSGKTSAVMIPAVMAASGAVISTATKPEVMRATVGARSEVGQAWLFDPTASEQQLPDGVRWLCWSPVAAACSWDEALVMARAMAACTRPGSGTTNEDHWTERASALLAPLLHAANLTDRPIAEVLRWTLRQDLAPARQVLLDCDTEIAADVLAGIEQTDSRERSSIFSATAGVLAAYNSDAVREGAAHPNFDPTRFAASTDTIYITAPEHRQSLCAPLIVGLLEQVRHAVYERAAQEEAEGPPMLWALDEVANIAPIHDLPSLVSQAGGQRLQVMVGLQDLSQARTRWGADAAEGFMSLFQTKAVLSGIGDTRTLESISVALGEYDRKVVSSSLGKGESDRLRDPDHYNESVSYQTQRQRVLTPGEIAKLPPGQALLLQGADWRLIGLTSWFNSEPWRQAAPPFPERLIHAASDGTQVRSKSELVVLETLLGMGLRPRYEERLTSPSDPDDYRLPDFTVSFDGFTFYWEHLGMLDVDSYARSWQRKRAWYERNGFLDRLITSADAPGGGLSVPEVKARAERRILRREPRQGEPGFEVEPRTTVGGGEAGAGRAAG